MIVRSRVMVGGVVKDVSFPLPRRLAPTSNPGADDHSDWRKLGAFKIDFEQGQPPPTSIEDVGTYWPVPDGVA